MRRTILLLSVAVALLASAPLRAQDLTFSFFGDYLESLRRQAGIPGLTAVIVGSDAVLWSRAFGSQNTDRGLAMRTDTPSHVDGLTQLLTATIVLRCVEEGSLSLSDRAGQFAPDSPDANATLAQLLSHTSGPAGGATFEYRPERLAPLARAVEYCSGRSFAATIATWLTQMSMMDSVPGVTLPAQAPADPDIRDVDLARYPAVLQRLATSYTVDRSGRATPSPHPVVPLTAGGGLVSTADDLAKFDLTLKRGILLKPETIAAAWTPAAGAGGQALPHGLGWFVQGYNGSRVAWQYGIAENASSSLVVTVVPRGLTLILIANSDGLAKPFALSGGDLLTSPFGKVFLGTFVR